MGKKRIEDLSSMELDVLREIGNIGGGHAATALSMLLAGQINMEVPILRVAEIDDAINALGGPENVVVGIMLEMSGDVSGIIMFLLENDFFKMLVKNLLGKEMDTLEKDSQHEIEVSLLAEVGNILAGSYLKALSQLTGLTISLSPPDLCYDMVGAIMNLPAAVFGVDSDKVLMIQEDFTCGDESIRSHLIMLPQEESFQNIFKRLGVL